MSSVENTLPWFDTGLGRIYVNERIVREVVVPEIMQSSYFFPPGSERAQSELARTGRNLVKHISVSSTGNTIRLAIGVDVLYGAPVRSETRHLQAKIKRSIELATGLEVERIDVDIHGLTMPEESSETNEEKAGEQ